MTHATRFDLAGKRIWVAGHRGMVGAALCRRLAGTGCEIVTAPRSALDLRRQAAVEDWLAATRPDAVIMAAARVGGIAANAGRPAEFLYDNLTIETNIIHGAARAGVAKLLFLGSSCTYPRSAAQPIGEDALLSGPLEPTNEWYAVAKIAGLKLCQAYRRQYGCDFITAQPNNLYGPGDHFDAEGGHVIPALMLKLHRARLDGRRQVALWGSGTPLREFLHVDDGADALVFLLEHYSDEAPINIGGGEELSIRALAERIAAAVGYEGAFAQLFDKPDGMPRKLLDGRRLAALGWRAKIDLTTGLRDTYGWFLKHIAPTLPAA